MDCRLTLTSVILSLLVGAANGESAQAPSLHDDSAAIGDATLSVHWEGLPLRDAIARLAETSKVAVFVDRRIDPTQQINLSVEDATADEILEKLAATRSLGVSRLDSVLYLGPARTADELSSLAALRREDIAKLSPQEQPLWSKKIDMSWPRLTEPRDLVTRLLYDHGLQVAGAERIPYDLWPAGRLPRLTLADGLTVLLAGFDLTFRPLPGQPAIEIIPIGELAASAPQVSAATKPIHPASGKRQHTKQLFTLRVQEQPVTKVLDQLEGQLHLDVTVDEAAVRAAGRSLDQRVSFEVKDADLDGLLEAVLQPAGLTFKRDGERLTITAR
jgi:type II secretory pathway component GspD/PulD (secretin)